MSAYRCSRFRCRELLFSCACNAAVCQTHTGARPLSVESTVDSQTCMHPATVQCVQQHNSLSINAISFVQIPLYTTGRRQAANRLHGTVCELHVFSSHGACTPATLRRLPRGGAAMGASKVIRPHAPEIGLKAISKALLNSVSARFFAFQERCSGSTTAVAVRFVAICSWAEVATTSAAAVAVPRAALARGDVSPGGYVVET